MDSKPKARSPAKQAQRAKKTKEKSQRERFIETARELGVDETGIEFERSLSRLVPPKPRQDRETT